MRKTITLINNQVVLEDWWLDLLAKNARYIEEEEIRKEGIKQGINQGIEQGIDKGIEETIINMLKENIDIEVISRVTNKTKEEILEIKNKLETINE